MGKFIWIVIVVTIFLHGNRTDAREQTSDSDDHSLSIWGFCGTAEPMGFCRLAACLSTWPTSTF